MGYRSLFEQLGEDEKALKLRTEAEQLKAKFEKAFWMNDTQFYAIALDKEEEASWYDYIQSRSYSFLRHVK